MRGTLVEKCKEVILSNRWVHDNQVMKPQKLFQDLLSFHNITGEQLQVKTPTPTGTARLKARYTEP